MEMKKNFVINTAFYVIIAVLALVFWKYLLPILMPFVIGFIIASIVQLPLNALPLNGKRRTKAAAIVLCIAFYALVVWGMVFFSVKVIGEISTFAATIPDLVYKKLYPLIWDIGDWVQNILEPIDMTLAQLVNEVGKTVASTMAKYATQASGWAVKALATGVVSIPGALVTIIVTIVASFYIAADYRTVVDFLKRLIPASQRDDLVQVVSYARTAVVAYIKSYSILFCITFIVTQVELNLVVVQLKESTALRNHVVGKLLDVIVCSELLLQLGKDVQTENLVVAVCFLVVFGSYYL